MNLGELRKAVKESEELPDSTPVTMRTWGRWRNVPTGEEVRIETSPRTATAETGCGLAPVFAFDCYELEEERPTEPAPPPFKPLLTVVK